MAEIQIQPLLFGNDINAYSMARSYYEAYGIPSAVFCKTSYGVCGNSKICNLTVHEKLDTQEVFLPLVKDFALKNSDKTIVISACGDNYVELIIKNKANFPKNVVAPFIDQELMDKLIRKEDFYSMCDKYGLDYPKTFLYTRDMGDNFTLPFDFPVIMKPSDGVQYWQHPFEGQKKALRLDNQSQLVGVLNDIYNAGYPAAMIIQDMIPGDDSNLRVMTALSGVDSRTIFTSMGHPLLEEHTPKGVGNTTIIMACHDEQLSTKISLFLQSIGYTGMSNFDMKFDSRDGKYKIFEINCRQGRNNYYVTGGGEVNIPKYICDEFVFGVKNPYIMTKSSFLWTVIPMGVAYHFVKERKYIPQLKQLVKQGKKKNPLFFKGDLSLKRRIFLLRQHFSHYIKYWKYYR